MKRIRQKSINLLNEKIQLSIPLYSDESIELEALPAKPVKSYNGISKFNHILIHFGKLLERVKGRKFSYTNEGLFVPEPTKILDKFILELTDLVNKIGNSIDKNEQKQLAFEYKKILNQIAKILNKSIEDKLNTSYTFVPLRGGAHVVSAFQVPFESMIAIDCKRLPLVDGSFAFGMNSPVFDPYDVDRVYKKKVRVVEVCIASGITSVGIMLDFFAKGCLPEELVFQVLFASKAGISFIQEVGKELGVKVKIYAVKIFNRLGDLTMPYDSIINEKGEKVLGDASAILDLTIDNYK
jgi:hypothetical protein